MVAALFLIVTFKSTYDRQQKQQLPAELLMRFEAFCFGSIRIDGITYNHDVVIDRGKVRKRKKLLIPGSEESAGPQRSLRDRWQIPSENRLPFVLGRPGRDPGSQPIDSSARLCDRFPCPGRR